MSDQSDQGARPARGSIAGRPDRRAVLKGAAAAGAVVPFLVACGSSSAGGSGSLRQPSSGGNGGNNGGGNRPRSGQAAGGSSADVLTTTGDVPTGGGVILDSDGIVITQPTAGEFKGFTNICTHMGCPVSNISGGTINCFCHGSQFSISDGSVVAGPAPSPLAEKPIEVQGKDIVAG